MLKSWSIQNFKAIVDSGNLKLAPVTVLAGRNSSGKSSLLQSILMISQTLSSRLLDRSLLPNGIIVQLGTMEDILSDFQNSSSLSISFELDFARELEENRADEEPQDEDFPFDSFYEFEGSGTKAKKIEIVIKFESQITSRTKSNTLDSVLNQVSVKVTPGDVWKISGTEYNWFTLVGAVASKAELDTFLQDVFLGMLPYDKEQTSYLSEIKTHDDRSEGPFLTRMSHFLPNSLYQKVKKVDDYEERLKAVLIYVLTLESRYNLTNPEYPTPDVSSFIADYKQELIGTLIEDVQESFTSKLTELAAEENVELNLNLNTLSGGISDLFKLVLNDKGKDRAKAMSEKLQQWIIREISIEQAKKDYNKHLEIVTDNITILNLDRAAEQVTNFFSSKIRYLGPLRADPQASQKYPPSSELDDVGSKGEYAAAVYDANQNAVIDWYNPVSKQVEQGTLRQALNAWVDHLGVANRIGIETAGQSGFSWQVVHREGRKPLPLSAVGVGVSQILPILVMGLLSPKGSLLIIEQPELHLHARVQALLGDFFVGLSKCNKQCLIETHSENLVSQLRLHIVQSGGLEDSDCMIYFVDQNKQGAAKFEEVEISKNGNILNWPDGFFDETMHQENRITAASIRRRAKLAEKHA